MLTIKQWQKDNPQLLNRMRGQMERLDEIHMTLMEGVVGELEEIGDEMNPFSVGSFLDNLGPRLQSLQHLASTFEDMCASYDERGNPIQ